MHQTEKLARCSCLLRPPQFLLFFLDRRLFKQKSIAGLPGLLPLVQNPLLLLRGDQKLPFCGNSLGSHGNLVCLQLQTGLIICRSLLQFVQRRYFRQRQQFLDFYVGLGKLLRPLFRFFFQTLFHHAVILGLEQHLHDCLPLTGLGQQQPAKITLRQQNHLTKLIALKTENPLHFRRDPARLLSQYGDFLPGLIEFEQLGVFADFHHAFAAFPRDILPGNPPHPEPVGAHRKIETDLRDGRCFRIIAAHVFTAADFAAGIAVQRVAHGIQQSGFA